MATKKTIKITMPARRGRTVSAKARVKKRVAKKRGKTPKMSVAEMAEKLRNRRNTKGQKPMSAKASIAQKAKLAEMKKAIERLWISVEKLRTGK